jgi:hypothetical protein
MSAPIDRRPVRLTSPFLAALAPPAPPPRAAPASIPRAAPASVRSRCRQGAGVEDGAVVPVEGQLASNARGVGPGFGLPLVGCVGRVWMRGHRVQRQAREMIALARLELSRRLRLPWGGRAGDGGAGCMVGPVGAGRDGAGSSTVDRQNTV